MPVTYGDQRWDVDVGLGDLEWTEDPDMNSESDYIEHIRGIHDNKRVSRRADYLVLAQWREKVFKRLLKLPERQLKAIACQMFARDLSSLYFMQNVEDAFQNQTPDSETAYADLEDWGELIQDCSWNETWGSTLMVLILQHLCRLTAHSLINAKTVEQLVGCSNIPTLSFLSGMLRDEYPQIAYGNLSLAQRYSLVLTNMLLLGVVHNAHRTLGLEWSTCISRILYFISEETSSLRETVWTYSKIFDMIRNSVWGQ